jgi:hypothetical protein
VQNKNNLSNWCVEAAEICKARIDLHCNVSYDMGWKQTSRGVGAEVGGG